MTKFFRVFLLTMACLLLGNSLTVAETIRIGLLCPLTGAYANEGQDMRRIVELLADGVNQAGGINGKRIEILTQDDASEPRTSALAAQRLATSNVVAVIGTYGSAVTEASQSILAEAGIVQIATGSTSVRLTEKGIPTFFRTCPRDDDQGAKAVRVLIDKGYGRIAILHDNSAYARGLADEIRAGLESAEDKEIIFFDALRPNERDYKALLTTMRSRDPEIVMFTGYYPEAATLLRQMAEIKWEVPMIGGDATNNRDLVKLAGGHATGYHFLSPAMPSDLDTESGRAFLAAYQEKFGDMPSSIWPVLAGDAFKVLVEAIKGAGADSAAIAHYLRNKLKDFSGLTGEIYFNEKGDRAGNLYYLYKVNDQGEFVKLYD
jgi:branched-chain amino acid transport system substrate-binding protein